jgi:hypothetical protein
MILEQGNLLLQFVEAEIFHDEGKAVFSNLLRFTNQRRLYGPKKEQFVLFIFAEFNNSLHVF